MANQVGGFQIRTFFRFMSGRYLVGCLSDAIRFFVADEPSGGRTEPTLSMKVPLDKRLFIENTRTHRLLGSVVVHRAFENPTTRESDCRRPNLIVLH